MLVLHLINKTPGADRSDGIWNVMFQFEKTDFVGIATNRDPMLAYTLAATFDGEDKDEAFRLTNSIEGPWFLSRDTNLAPTLISKRSTSVGDLLVHDHHVYVVAPVGFKQIDIAPGDVVHIQ